MECKQSKAKHPSTRPPSLLISNLRSNAMTSADWLTARSYVWGDNVAKAKTTCESLDYIFQLAVEMQKLGLSWT